MGWAMAGLRRRPPTRFRWCWKSGRWARQKSGRNQGELMEWRDVNVVLAVAVDPKLSGWLGWRIWAHSCAQKQGRAAYRAAKKRIIGGMDAIDGLRDDKTGAVE